MRLAELISVAKGDSPADLVLRNCRIVNTFVGEVEHGNVAICGDRIAGVGDYHKARETIDLRGDFLAPGLINGHTHIESSMLHPAQYARAVVPRGTLAVVSDLHEIANVCGSGGIEFVMHWARKLPLDMFFMAPSCVPATHLENSGAALGAEDIRELFRYRSVIGLGEMMNFPGVVNGVDEVLRKIGVSRGRVIDGHAPGLSGMELNAYLSAGIMSDHESTVLDEGREKLRKGMHLMIREGSSEKNLDTLLPLVTDNTYGRCLFVVDDRSCNDLSREGDIDAVVRKAIRGGLEPVRAIQLATINAAQYFRLYDRGGIAPGYLANLVTLTDLSELSIDRVFYKGRLVASGGEALFSLSRVPAELADTVRVEPVTGDKLRLPVAGGTYPVIDTIPGQIVTRKSVERVKTHGGEAVSDTERDILKAAVVERHRASGNVGVGLVRGFGLKKGAIASSMAHDSHNIVVVGTTDQDMLAAIRQVVDMRGGLVACAHGELVASLPLPIAGLLSPEPLEVVVQQHDRLEEVTAGLGDLPPAPFAILSFLALPVIPELRLTDLGLVDVTEFRLLKQGR